MIVFRKPLPGIERPVMEADVVIVGGGPAGMACALRLSQLIDEHNASIPTRQLTKENIYLLEKAREVGAHCLSGALLDPRSMRELLPDFEKEAPLDAAVTKEAVYFLTRTGKFKFPITPPPMRDHGNYVISINKFVKWLGSKVEEAGITVFTGFAGSELLFDDWTRCGRAHRRQRRGQERRAEVQFRARLRFEGQGRHSRRGHARLADQATHRPLSARSRTQSADLRRRREGTVGVAAPAASLRAKSSTPWAIR